MFADVLLADPSDRDNPASGQRDGRTEDGFGHEDALGMVAERAVPEVGDDHLRFIEPVMDADIVLRDTTPLLHAGKRVVIRMSHGPSSKMCECRSRCR